MALRIASYNVHNGMGPGGRTDYARTLEVLKNLECDVIALQEVSLGADPIDSPLARLAEGTGYASVALRLWCAQAALTATPC